MYFIKSTIARLHRLSFSVAFLASLFCSINSFSQYTKVLDFGSTSNGSNPYGSVITDGTYLYGMTYDGGANNYGTIYKVKTDGSGFIKLLDFDGANNGANPYGSLFYDGTFLYGMAYSGGANNIGTVFKLKPDGTGFSKLLDFSGTANGSYPRGSFISDGVFLYGTSSSGGANSDGIIFKIKPDGTGFTKLHDFDGTSGNTPNGPLYSDGTFLYGVASSGGPSNYGTIFKLMPDGTSFATVLNLNSYYASFPYVSPTLISDGTFLYGTTQRGGANDYGTIFKVMPDGTSFSTVLDFTTASGATPKALSYDGTFLYGTTAELANGAGTIYKIKTDGTGLTVLLNNDINNLQTYADATLLIVGSTLYGVMHGGSGYLNPIFPGTVFKINNDGTGYSKLFFFETAASYPTGSFYSDGTYFYATSSGGGLYDNGTVFRIKPDGTGYQDLYDFGSSNDGITPYSSLVSDGTFFYGITNSGGVNSIGTIFKIKSDGTGYSKLFDFDNTNGRYPQGSLFYDGSFLYGMANQGGTNGYGVIFKMDAAGAISKLFDFDNATTGGYPRGAFISDGTFLYGTTSYGGSLGNGTIFKIKPDGTNFTKLLDLDNTNYGAQPLGDLYYDGTFLYALTSSGGIYGNGAIIKLKTDGTSPSKLLDFDGANNGASPLASLASDGTYLYGVTQYGGNNNAGTLFRIKPDGSTFQKFFDFGDGQNPMATPLITGGFLYGTTNGGGANGRGILFKTTLTPFVSVSGFTPDNGIVGSYVTITGLDFDPIPGNNVVKFNGVSAVVKSSTTTSITVVVPNATSGLITVTANGTTGTSTTNFTVSTQTAMTDGIVQSCAVDFTEPNDTNDHVETFVPATAGDKISITFSSFSAGDILNVYDGPATSSPLIQSLTGNLLPATITATGAGGELTFEFLWQDNFSTTWQATISCATTNSPPALTSASLATHIGGSANIPLLPLISTSSGSTLDQSSIKITVPPVHGNASINSSEILTIDYAGVSYVGKDSLTFKACDIAGACATQQIFIDVVGDIIVYNGVSPGGKNPSLVIENIEILPDTQQNTVYIFDRWENPVWHGSNYDNTSVVFTGSSDNGNALPSGVYFYKIDFKSGRSTKTGFISLRR